MRVCATILLAAGLAAGCGAKQGAETTATRPSSPPQFRIALEAPTHTPRARSKWWYVVRATAPDKRPVPGRLTVEVVDPLGTAHVADVGTSKRKLLRFPFGGRYRDFAMWPSASRGYRLRFRVTVTALGQSRSLAYWVQPR
jgi:hypothetical protein